MLTWLWCLFTIIDEHLRQEGEKHYEVGLGELGRSRRKGNIIKIYCTKKKKQYRTREWLQLVVSAPRRLRQEGWCEFQVSWAIFLCCQFQYSLSQRMKPCLNGQKYWGTEQMSEKADGLLRIQVTVGGIRRDQRVSQFILTQASSQINDRKWAQKETRIATL